MSSLQFVNYFLTTSSPEAVSMQRKECRQRMRSDSVRPKVLSNTYAHFASGKLFCQPVLDFMFGVRYIFETICQAVSVKKRNILLRL